MSYQVLARKYRPQAFIEVVGQDHITKTLKNAIAGGRLHHAYLFVGVRGTGKTTVARILAKALNCEKKSGEEPCGVCGSCKDIANGNSLDVQEIDGASNTGVDDVRELRERTKYLPTAGKYKIYVIDEVHMLSNNAFNALLKTLEEPPPHVIFIFATTEAHKIPATILSRCQRYDFRRIPVSAIAGTLKRIAGTESISIDDDALHLIAREATGSLRDAESLFDQAIAFSGNSVSTETIKTMLGFLDRKLIFDLAEAVVNKDPKRALDVLDEVFITGADLVRFAMDYLEILRHLLVLAECGDGRGLVDLPNDETGALKSILEKVGAPELHQMFSLWYKVAEEVPRSSFPKMLLEVGLIRICRVEPVKPIEDIVARLDAVMGDVPTPAPVYKEVQKKEPVPQIQQQPQPVVHPTFEPVGSPQDVDAEKKWLEFMRFVVNEKPQVASILQNGVLSGIDDGVVNMAFDNLLYADMLSEEARKNQVEAMFEKFFKRTMRLVVSKNASAKPKIEYVERKKDLIQEAIGSDIVRQAADILNAQLHDVKVEGKK